MNKILSPTERRALKARAHPLKPTVMIGNDGLSASVLQEIDATLKSHELIKIKVDHDDSDEREDMLGLICASTGASAIDHIGKMLVVYRERPQSAKGGAPGANQGGRANASRNKGNRNGAAAQGQGPGGEGQRKAAKKSAGPVWTKVRQQRGRKGGGRPGSGGPNRGQGGGNRGGGGNNGGGNSGNGGGA